MKRLGIAEAREGITEEMERDPRVFCIGEDIGVGGWGGASPSPRTGPRFSRPDHQHADANWASSSALRSAPRSAGMRADRRCPVWRFLPGERPDHQQRGQVALRRRYRSRS